MGRTMLVIAGLGVVLAVVVVIAAVSTKKSGEEIMTEVNPTLTVISPAAPTVGPTASQNMMPLTITSPTEGASLTGMSVVVKGQTAPGADVGINQLDVKADSKGNFSATISLDEGENTITVITNDDAGNMAEKDITVTVAGPAQ